MGGRLILIMKGFDHEVTLRYERDEYSRWKNLLALYTNLHVTTLPKKIKFSRCNKLYRSVNEFNILHC